MYFSCALCEFPNTLGVFFLWSSKNFRASSLIIVCATESAKVESAQVESAVIFNNYQQNILLIIHL